jgi:hypothetical protein
MAAGNNKLKATLLAGALLFLSGCGGDDDHGSWISVAYRPVHRSAWTDQPGPTVVLRPRRLQRSGCLERP